MQVPESLLSSLKSLSLRFEVSTLAKQCDEMMERFKLNKKLFDSGKSVEISYPSSRLNGPAVFLNKIPIDIKRLNSFLSASEYSDVDIYVEGHGQVAKSHRIILGLWSAPFTKVWQYLNRWMLISWSSKHYICIYEENFTNVKIAYADVHERNDWKCFFEDLLEGCLLWCVQDYAPIHVQWRNQRGWSHGHRRVATAASFDGRSVRGFSSSSRMLQEALRASLWGNAVTAALLRSTYGVINFFTETKPFHGASWT